MYTKLNTNTLYNTLCTIHCTIHCVQYTVYNTLCTIHCVQYTVYKTLCKIHCVKYTVYNSLCTIYKMNSPGLFYLFISITMFTNCARAAKLVQQIQVYRLKTMYTIVELCQNLEMGNLRNLNLCKKLWTGAYSDRSKGGIYPLLLSST